MIKHSVDHVRGVLDAVLDAARDAADTLVGADMAPGSLAAAGIANASHINTSAARGLILQASGGTGAPFWVLLAALCVIALGLVLCCAHRVYSDPARSGTPPPKPRAPAASATARLPSSSSFRAWSAVGSGHSSKVPPPAPTPAPGSTRGLRAITGPQLLRRLTSAGSRYSLKDSSPSGAATAQACRPSARFVVPLDSLADLGDAGRFSIVDAIGGTTFSVVLSQDKQGLQRLQLLTQTQATCASAELAEGVPGGGPRLELRGPGGLLLGSLAPREDGAMVVHKGGQPQFIIRGNEGHEGTPDLEVSTKDGRPTATISCTQDGPDGAEHVEFNIFDVANVQLVVCCVFAMLFLWREGH